MEKKGLFRILKIAGNVLMVASIVFIAYSLYTMDVDYSYILQPQILGFVLLFAVLYAFTVYCVGFAWRLILQFLAGKRVPFRDVYPVYTKANMGKYLPGNFMHYANRNLFGVSLGLSQLDIAFSSILEVVYICVTAFIWSLLLAGDAFIALFARYTASISNWILLAAALVALAAMVLVLVLLYKKNRQYFAKLKQFLSLKFVGLSVENLLIYSFTLLVPGVTLVVVLSWSDPAAMENAFLIISAYVVSWVIGFIVPGAPGGIGVREAVLVLMLGGVTLESSIMVAVVIQRLISIIGDILAYASGIVLHKLAQRKAKSTA